MYENSNVNSVRLLLESFDSCPDLITIWLKVHQSQKHTNRSVDNKLGLNIDILCALLYAATLSNDENVLKLVLTNLASEISFFSQKVKFNMLYCHIYPYHNIYSYYNNIFI